jgi:hypothetical protein
MTDKEHAVMDELWRNVNSLRWQNERRLEAIHRYREWLPRCTDGETRRYYKKWLDFLEKETYRDIKDAERQRRVASLTIERPS